MSPASLSVVARRFSFVRETDGPNDGAWVAFIQRWTGNAVGDSWCSSFVSLVEDIAYRGHAPTKRTASCQEKLDDARRKGFVVSAPAPDDLYFYTALVDGEQHAHHVGVVTNTRPLTGIAGNTSEDGASSNGDGVWEHAINPAHCVFVRLPSAA